MSAILPHMVWPYGYSIPLTNMRRPSLSFRIDSYSQCCLQETYNTDIYYCAPAGTQSVAMSMSVSSHISTVHAQTLQNSLYMLTVATDRSSPDTTSNVLPVLWMTSRLPMIWRVANEAYSQSDSAGGRPEGKVWRLRLLCYYKVKKTTDRCKPNSFTFSRISWQGHKLGS